MHFTSAGYHAHRHVVSLHLAAVGVGVEAADAQAALGGRDNFLVVGVGWEVQVGIHKLAALQALGVAKRRDGDVQRRSRLRQWLKGGRDVHDGDVLRCNASRRDRDADALEVVRIHDLRQLRLGAVTGAVEADNKPGTRKLDVAHASKLGDRLDLNLDSVAVCRLDFGFESRVVLAALQLDAEHLVSSSQFGELGGDLIQREAVDRLGANL